MSKDNHNARYGANNNKKGENIMDIGTITTFVAPVAAFVAGIIGGPKLINRNKSRIEQLEADIQAVKAGADGTLKLLGEIVAASEDNTLTAEEFSKIVAAASDIPTAVRMALKMSAVNPVASAIAPAQAA